MKRMLLVFAHPGDESYSCAGTVAKYVNAQWQVDLVCATRGESGSYEGLSQDELGNMRQKELEEAAAILGISTVSFLGFSDDRLRDEPAGELEDLLYRKMQEVVPDIVVTYDTTGINNHPDHIRISYSATYAFQKYAGDVEESLKDNPEYSSNMAPKLYYACVPESVASYLKKQKVFPEESYGKVITGTSDKFITTVISCDGLKLQKKKAIRAYVSKREDASRYLSLSHNPLIAEEFFLFRMQGTREIFMGKNDRVSSKL